MKIRIEPYKVWSGGAKSLGEYAGILRATRRQVEKHGDFDYIINWGCSTRRFNGEYVNKPEAVAAASDKLRTARILDEFDVSQPPYTTDPQIAAEWLFGGGTVFARTLLRANSGRGIVEVGPGTGSRLPRAPMYTLYCPKTDEYRIHVLGDRVIDVQMKRRNMEIPDDKVNWRIRNTSSGFVFCRDDVTPPACVSAAAVRAVSALGLDFGAVDVGYNAKRDKCRVYEVNTAPGLEGTTLDRYYTAFCEVFPSLQGGRYRTRRQAHRV